MDDVALADYVLGLDPRHVEAGHVSLEFAQALGVAAGTVIWFSDYTLLKLRERHGDITFEHYRYMPRLLLNGFAAHSLRPRHLELWWLDESDAVPAAFFAALKATAKNEVFLATFHPRHRKDARRLARKAEREHRLLRIQPGFADFKNI